MAGFCCPLCGSKTGEDLYVFNTAVLIEDKITEYGLHHVLCSKCGVIMVYPLPEHQSLQSYYTGAYPFEYKLMDSRQMAAHQFILRHVGSTCRSVLDIGAGSGYFLSLFQQQGWECSGIEPSKRLVETARAKYGIGLLPCGFEELDEQQEYRGHFQLAAMNHVLEHIYSLGALFSQVRSVLQPHAYFYIEVPSLEMFADNEVDSEIMAFTHLWHFTGPSLKNLLAGNGFRAVALEPCYEGGHPVLRALFEREHSGGSEGTQARGMPQEDIEHAKVCFLKHVSRREKKQSLALDRIRGLLQGQRPVVFYGAGEDMYDLMVSAPGVFRQGNYHIVDSNPGKWSKTICGKEIQEPQVILGLNNPVVCITSRLFTIQASIADSIRSLGSSRLDIERLFG